MLQYPNIIQDLSISSCNFISFHVMYLDPLFLESYTFKDYVFLVYWPLIHYVIPLIILITFLLMKFSLSKINIATSLFFWLVSARYIPFHPFTFFKNLYCKQPIVLSCFLVQSDNLYHLLCVFRPLTNWFLISLHYIYHILSSYYAFHSFSAFYDFIWEFYMIPFLSIHVSYVSFLVSFLLVVQEFAIYISFCKYMSTANPSPLWYNAILVHR